MEELNIKEEKIVTKESWLDKELENIKENSYDGERKPALKLEENKTVTMTIDFSEPFQKWEDTTDGKTITKKIIPVKVGEVEFVWWLNVKNPVYGKLVELGSKGQTEFKVIQTGTQKNTKYILLED